MGIAHGVVIPLLGNRVAAAPLRTDVQLRRAQSRHVGLEEGPRIHGEGSVEGWRLRRRSAPVEWDQCHQSSSARAGRVSVASITPSDCTSSDWPEYSSMSVSAVRIPARSAGPTRAATRYTAIFVCPPPKYPGRGQS